MTTFDLGFLPSFITAPDSVALCAEIDPEIWFPERGGSARAAKRLCGRCELEGSCLDWALDNREGFGVWGGKSERERKRILRNLDTAPRGLKPIPHGTDGGYRTHQRRGQPVPADDPCGCRAASRQADQVRRARHEQEAAA